MSTKTRILVVDDDVDIRELLESILRAHGYEVTRAGSGAAALDLLRAGLKPCLVLVDLEMPLMSGGDLAAEMARDEALKDIPVVLTSASREQLDRFQRSLSTLEKPFLFERLMEIVREHCSPVTQQ